MWKTDQAVATPPAVGNDVGRSVSIKGELSGSEDMTLHGQLEGRVSLPNNVLTVGPQAAVKADIAARAVVVKGAVTGNVTAAERLEILSNGSVLGDIVSPRLVIADGGSLQGKVDMRSK
ncbi:MAG TPA: polymer-forming cytoskeletal protein [Vicinamibacterales bacterium]|nr:polymer-forming cytoskeletal protein [Vicinamibacterales bacterium]